MGGGWGYGPGWGWGGRGGMGSSTTTVRQYNVATVVLDLWDAKQKRLVWRGTVSDTLSDNPQKNAKKIHTAAEKLFKDYPPTGISLFGSVLSHGEHTLRLLIACHRVLVARL